MICPYVAARGQGEVVKSSWRVLDINTVAGVDSRVWRHCAKIAWNSQPCNGSRETWNLIPIPGCAKMTFPVRESAIPAMRAISCRSRYQETNGGVQSRAAVPYQEAAPAPGIFPMKPGNTTAGPATVDGGVSELFDDGAGDEMFKGITRPLEMLTFWTLFSYIISSV